MGQNLWVKQLRKEDGDLDVEGAENPRTINIGGKATVFMGKGDRLVIQTPGGGAWGHPGEEKLYEAGGVKASLDTVVDKMRGAMEWAARGSLAERAAAQAGFGGF